MYSKGYANDWGVIECVLYCQVCYLRNYGDWVCHRLTRFSLIKRDRDGQRCGGERILQPAGEDVANFHRFSWESSRRFSHHRYFHFNYISSFFNWRVSLLMLNYYKYTELHYWQYYRVCLKAWNAKHFAQYAKIISIGEQNWCDSKSTYINITKQS